MPQYKTAAILVVVLVVIIIAVAVIAVVLSGRPAGPQYPGMPSSTSWCVAGQTTSLASYGAQGYATFNGMATFQGQSLCKATLSTNGQTYYFYTNEASTVWYTTDVNNNIVTSYLGPSGQQPPTPQNELIKTALNSLSLTSGQEGTVSTATGASVKIPAGAVPLGQNGQAGTMVFSINQRNDVTPTFPTGFLPAGPVYEFGPEGFNFELPVQVTLPIQQGVDPSMVGGLAYYDDATQKWIRIPGTVDPTTRTVSTYTTHFTQYTPWYAPSWQAEMNLKGGWIKVKNSHSYLSGSYGITNYCRGKPTTTGYGVCIKSWVPKNAQDSTWWNAGDTLIWSFDHPPQDGESWVPPGDYELVEILSVSEVNYDPLYVPCYSKYWRSLGTHTIGVGQSKQFDGGSSSDTSQWTKATDENPPPCWGVKTTAGGTGDVQVTLTWHSSVDLDLHVTDPGSEEISWNNKESSTGGKLDIDNRCGNFVMGKPENVFWPTGGAPSGTYKVKVRYYTPCSDSGSVAYTVRVVAKGQVSTYSGTLSTSGDENEVTTFSI
jgi:hypothetical protein